MQMNLTVTCKLSLRISELVPVRQDGTMFRESSDRHTTNPAMQFTICYQLGFNLIIIHFSVYNFTCQEVINEEHIIS